MQQTAVAATLPIELMRLQREPGGETPSDDPIHQGRLVHETDRGRLGDTDMGAGAIRTLANPRDASLLGCRLDRDIDRNPSHKEGGNQSTPRHAGDGMTRAGTWVLAVREYITVSA